MGLKQDGHWDGNTDNAMKEILNKPTCGVTYTHKYAVRYIQWWLGINLDGIFYTMTKIVVQKYQKNNGLTANGIVESDTWDKIF
jgi:peptidoglycan hydrolase-like protein with peptidoglycan-binding domain